MRKYYLEVESYKIDDSIIQLRIVDQRTKNRRYSFVRNPLRDIRIEFFEIPSDNLGLLSCAYDLGEASVKLMKLKMKVSRESIGPQPPTEK